MKLRIRNSIKKITLDYTKVILIASNLSIFQAAHMRSINSAAFSKSFLMSSCLADLIASGKLIQDPLKPSACLSLVSAKSFSSSLAR